MDLILRSVDHETVIPIVADIPRSLAETRIVLELRRCRCCRKEFVPTAPHQLFCDDPCRKREFRKNARAGHL
jgi:hypothetical protein